MKINKGDYIEMSRTKPWQQQRFIKLCEDCGFKKSDLFDLCDEGLGVGELSVLINTCELVGFSTNITDKFLAWLEENPAFCIDVSGFDIEKKKRVQEAFFKIGFRWPYGDHGEFRNLEKNVYANFLDTGEVLGHLMYGSALKESDKPYEVTYDELMEIAGMKDEVNLKGLLKDGMRCTDRDGDVWYVCGDKMVLTDDRNVDDLDDWDENLFDRSCTSASIMLITDRDGTVVWERHPEKRKVTLELTEEQERTIKEQLGL